jgi:hypothetical protein
MLDEWECNLTCVSRIFDSDYDLEAQYHSLLNGESNPIDIATSVTDMRLIRQMGSFHGSDPLGILLLATGTTYLSGFRHNFLIAGTPSL